MDPFSIIAIASVNWLVRFLKCSGEAAANKVQEEVGTLIWNKVKNFFGVVEENFKANKNASQIIESLKNVPASNESQQEVSNQLLLMMKMNENLSKQLNSLLSDFNKPSITEKIDIIIYQTTINGNYNNVNQISGNHGGINIGQVTGQLTINQQVQVNIEQLTADGSRMLRGKNYKKAYEAFDKVNSLDDSNPNLPFYLSLCILAGRRPKILKLTEINEIENYLESSIEYLAAGAHYYYLKAIILYDFYLLNGFDVEISSINGWLDKATDAVYDEVIINEMFKHMPGVDKEIADIIRTE